MVRYIIVSIVSGILFGVLDGLINANPLAQRLYEVYKPIAKPVFDRQIVTSCDLPSVMPGVFFARLRAAHLNNRAKEHPAQREL